MRRSILLMVRMALGLNPTDYRRWADPENCSNGWDGRNKVIASLIPPRSRVLEFGVGMMTLPKYLPENCTWLPSDIFQREPRVLVCDLNAAIWPELPDADIVVFSGVLEYVRDVRRVIERLSNYRSVIASYAVVEDKSFATVLKRRKHAFINDYSESDFISIFQNHGFNCADKMFWNDQLICRFTRAQEIVE